MAEKSVKSEKRRERLAAALRENLKKRKNRARRAEEGQSTEGQPSVDVDDAAPPPSK